MELLLFLDYMWLPLSEKFKETFLHFPEEWFHDITNF